MKGKAGKGKVRKGGSTKEKKEGKTREEEYEGCDKRERKGGSG